MVQVSGCLRYQGSKFRVPPFAVPYGVPVHPAIVTVGCGHTYLIHHWYIAVHKCAVQMLEEGPPFWSVTGHNATASPASLLRHCFRPVSAFRVQLSV